MRFLAIACLALCGCQDMHRVNPGAKVAVYDWVSEADMRALNAQYHVDIRWGGLWHIGADGTEIIYIRGRLDRNAFTLVHECWHHLEKALAGNPEALKAARHAFRELCGPECEYGRNDLLTEIE